MQFSKLRWFQQAGGKLPNPCIQEILQAFPQVRYFLMYGQTEATARLSYLPPERLAQSLPPQPDLLLHALAPPLCLELLKFSSPRLRAAASF